MVNGVVENIKNQQKSARESREKFEANFPSDIPANKKLIHRLKLICSKEELAALERLGIKEESMGP
jgi:ribosomal protein S17E